MPRIVWVMVCLCLGCLATDVPAQEKSELFRQGQEVYTSTCADCHRSNGEGLPNAIASLAKSGFVAGDPIPVVTVILEGRKGNLGRMPAWKDTLTDQQIAAVVSFIRNNWGNKAEAVTPELVGKTRKK